MLLEGENVGEKNEDGVLYSDGQKQKVKHAARTATTTVPYVQDMPCTYTSVLYAVRNVLIVRRAQRAVRSLGYANR